MRNHGFLVIGLICCILILAPPEPALQAQALAMQPVSVLSPAQLSSLVSPIALYPDPLLSQVLVAATYPLEIVEAAQWLRKNQALTGSALQSAASQQNWDPSIQALVAFPDVLFRLGDDIKWTTDLGNAFLAQQTGVMDTIQQLRSQALAAGKLSTNPENIVTTQAQGDSSVVEIMPSDPEVIYVPSYDPMDIWGTDFYPYPFMPYFGGPYLYRSGWIGFTSCIHVGFLFGGWGGWGGWGWHPNWFGRSVMVNNGFFSRYGYNRMGAGGGLRTAGSGTWAHDPVHRAGVPYANHAVASQFHSVPRVASQGRLAPAMSFAHPSPMPGSRMSPQSANAGRGLAQIPSARTYQAPRNNFAPGSFSRPGQLPSAHSAPSFSSGGGHPSVGRSGGGGGGRSGGGGRPR